MLNFAMEKVEKMNNKMLEEVKRWDEVMSLFEVCCWYKQ